MVKDKLKQYARKLARCVCNHDRAGYDKIMSELPVSSLSVEDQIYVFRALNHLCAKNMRG